MLHIWSFFFYIYILIIFFWFAWQKSKFAFEMNVLDQKNVYSRDIHEIICEVSVQGWTCRVSFAKPAFFMIVISNIAKHEVSKRAI